MKTLIASLLLTAIAFADPKVDRNALLLPTFIFDQQPPVSAGFAFVFEEGDQRYAATAFHVFGPPGGMRVPLSARDIPNEIKAMAGICLGSGSTVIVAQPALFVDGARAVDAKGAEGDVALFRVPDVRAKAALRLAAVPAKIGDKVWLLTRLFDRAEARLYPAKIIEATPKLVRYRFDDASLNLRACSGAPMVDEFGVVVAMHLGFTTTVDGVEGAAIPAGAMREKLAAALKEE
jgi:hypothetical protein